MKTSDSVVKVSAALVKAQAAISSVTADRNNPHFGSRYATLDAVMNMARPALANAGLAVIQGGESHITTADGAKVIALTVTTRIQHESGEYIETILTMPLEKPTAQGVGSALTYARRYGLCAALGVTTDDDDDGNKASGGKKAAKPAPAPVQAANAVRATKLAELPFPTLKGFEEHKGKKFAEVPPNIIADAIRFLSTYSSKSAKQMHQAMTDYLEEREISDEPSHPALKAGADELEFPTQ